MLRKVRIVFAAVFFVGISLLFLDFTGSVHAWLGWMAKIQFLPALLAVNVVIVLAMLLLTLLFGRVYCSVVCPLGIMQDIISWLNSRRGKKYHNRFIWYRERKWLRYGVLCVFVLAFAFGLPSIAMLLAPYSTFGRIASNVFSPVYALGNNFLAFVSERVDSYAFYSTDVWIRSLAVFGSSLAIFVVIAVLAWKGGRTWCNNICPVGTFLGFFSRFSVFRPVINTDECINCGLCARGCKASCIDAKNHRIDYSRCVACMDCLDNCSKNAIHYTWRRKSDRNAVCDADRRRFLAGTGMLASTAILDARCKRRMQKGLAVVMDREVPQRDVRIVPPGALSLRNMETHCIGCQLCVSVCPSGVLRPSGELMSLMQPESSYERGYCSPDCVRCSEVCPTGAIIRITPQEKKSVQVGHAVWIRKNCLPVSDGVSCGNCARHCPVGAIRMVRMNPDDKSSLRIPVVDETKCIGCGICENLCPSRPFSAIYVEGYQVHGTVGPRKEGKGRTMRPEPVPCVGCKSCMPCSYGIDIPAIFMHHNKCIEEGNVPVSIEEDGYDKARRAYLVGYAREVSKEGQASHCISCGKCLPDCPMGINIPRELQKIDRYVMKLTRNEL